MTPVRSLFLFFLAIFMQSCVFPSGYIPTEIKIKKGDDLAWADPKIDDSNWRDSDKTSIKGRFWVRASFDFEASSQNNQPLGIFVVSIGSFDLYFDGTLIGNSGQIADSASKEIPGKTITYFLIPDSLAQEGEHLVALRVSNHHVGDHISFFQFLVADYFQLVRKPLVLTAFMYILAGIFFIVGVYYFFLFLKSNREWIVMIFSLSCFLFFALIFVEYLKFFVLYTYPYQYFRMDLIRWITILISVLIPFFFSLKFPFSGKQFILIVHLLFLFGLSMNYYNQYDELSQLASLLMWSTSTILVGMAMLKKKKGSGIVFLGLLSCIVLIRIFPFDISLFLSFGVIILSMLYALATSIQEQKLAYESSKLLSTRLEIELIKKNIQPHFLLNTLTSLIDWVEESPTQAVKFIESLAAEFKILGQIADQNLIPIKEEIALCKHHLEVMKYRNEIDYKWRDYGIDPNERIPPALLHTALENGITHSLPSEYGTVTFHLHFKKYHNYIEYALSTFGEQRRGGKTYQEGTGLRYMKARLQESYGSNWKLTSSEIKEGWKTTFIIYH